VGCIVTQHHQPSSCLQQLPGQTPGIYTLAEHIPSMMVHEHVMQLKFGQLPRCDSNCTIRSSVHGQCGSVSRSLTVLPC
jgi:hypothetical protein